jgi:hypothetical protein
VSILHKLFGRKAPNARDIHAKIAETNGSLADLRSRESALADARKAAVDALDEAALEAADRDLAAVRRKIELAESAIAQLQAAHGEQTAREEREAFKGEVAAYEAEVAETANRLANDYPPAVAAISAIVNALVALDLRKRELEKRAKRLGESVNLGNPESVRRNAPVRYFATWPNPEGDGAIYGPVEDAPRGAIRWIDGAPFSAREGVTITARPPEPLESLIYTVGQLPALHHDDGHKHDPRKRQAPVFNPPEWGRVEG